MKAMEDRIKSIIHRLYDIADIAYHTQYRHEESIIVADGKEWVMLRSDYDMIQDVKDVLEYYDKNVATFVLPLVKENKETLQRFRESGEDTITFKEPEYMTFKEFVRNRHYDLRDNCTLAGKWITLVDIDCDKVRVRVTEEEPKVVLDFSNGVTHRGYTYGGIWTFDWSDFYNGKYKYEDVFLDIPAGFQLVGSLESFKTRLDNDFWTPTMQTFSPD